MAQGLDGLAAIKLAVFVHGAAADKLVDDGVGPFGITASELTLSARAVLNQLNLAGPI
jgi:NAD(P)H-hydrate repair Nnr-like enzyme with NAD(P)H-hydrate dehydratase domain